MIKSVGTAICGAALTISAATVAFNSPVQWRSVRTSDVPVFFLADSTVAGSTMTLTLVENSDGRVVEKKQLTVVEGGNSDTLTVANPLDDGKAFYSLKWSVGDEEGVLAPLSVSPVEDGVDSLALAVPTVNDEITLTNATSSEPLFSSDEASVRMSWNPSSLVIVVESQKNVSLSIDPANLKGGFLSYSNRSITVDFSTETTTFSYSTRSLSDDGIAYETEQWNGDLSSEISDNVAVITIPWYDLGIKPFAGRQIGFLINGESVSYPENSSIYAPSTWGNILLK